MVKVFEYYKNILCVTAECLYGDLNLCSYDSYQHRCKDGRLTRERTARPGFQALVNFENLSPEWKKAIVEKYGDPYKTVKHQTFTDFVVSDQAAADFFRDYVYNGGTTLSFDKQREYTTNANLLNTIILLVGNRKARCKALGGRATRLWENMSEVLSSLDKSRFNHSLPSNPRSLQRICARYRQDRYSALIHKNFGNDHGEKINPNASIWLLSRWADQVRRVANENQLFLEYNAIAGEKGWKPLKDPKSLHLFLYREDIQELWWGHRYGELNAKEKFDYQHSTKLPTMRDSLWYSDGTKLNYFYQNDQGERCTTSVYEIMDAYSEVLLGYHVSATEDYVTQYCAYKMAVQFAGHKPYELGFDNQGGHKKLVNGNFLDKVSHLAIKKQPYNGKSKTIENAFSRFQSQFLKKDWFFTGQNIQAKKQESKANMEFILANVKNLPTLAAIKNNYKMRRDEWNNAPHPATGIPRIEMYLNSVNAGCPKVELWDMIDIFWVLRDKPVEYNAYGLKITEKKQEYIYSVYGPDGLPDMEWHRSNIDKKFFIKFDPEDMSTIILMDKDSNGNLRVVREASTKTRVVRGKQEQTQPDHDFIAAIKKLNQHARIDRVEKMESILVEHGASAEQYGLNKPKILGVNSKRKKAKKQKDDVIGRLLKDESEMVPVGLHNNDEEQDFDIYDKM